MADTVTNIIDTVLREKLGAYGLDHVEVNVGEDHTGDPALFVLAVLAPNSPLIPGEVSVAANVAVHDAVLKHGEQRFPYLFIRHPDDERPELASGPTESVIP
jgi:hypothetical protein